MWGFGQKRVSRRRLRRGFVLWVVVVRMWVGVLLAVLVATAVLAVLVATAVLAVLVATAMRRGMLVCCGCVSTFAVLFPIKEAVFVPLLQKGGVRGSVCLLACSPRTSSI
jgi:hypothetical protein